MLAFSDSFEYLCYGSTVIINYVYSYSAGIDFRRQNLTIRLIEVNPRAVRVKHQIIYRNFHPIKFVSHDVNDFEILLIDATSLKCLKAGV